MTVAQVFNKPSAWEGMESTYRSKLAMRGVVRSIIEVGVDYGFSLFHMALDFPHARVYGVDPYGEYALHDDAEAHITAALPLFGNVTLLKGGREIVKVLKLPRVDLIHLDADHSYDSVKADFEVWEPYLRIGGCMMFHDILSFPQGPGRLFQELRGRKDMISHSCGLGFWFKE